MDSNVFQSGDTATTMVIGPRGKDPPGRSFDNEMSSQSLLPPAIDDDEHLLRPKNHVGEISSFLAPTLLDAREDIAADLDLARPKEETTFINGGEHETVAEQQEEDDVDVMSSQEHEQQEGMEIAEDVVTQPDQNPQDPQEDGVGQTKDDDLDTAGVLDDIRTARTYIKKAQSLYAIASDRSPREPGAYLVQKIKHPGKELVSITVPVGARPNELFEVRLGIRRVRIVCPFTAPPGSRLSVQVDREDTYHQTLLKPAILTASPVASKFFGRQQHSSTRGILIGGAYPMIPDLKQVYLDAKQDATNVHTKIITIPETAVPGEKFEYVVAGKRYRLLCPATSQPGDRLRIAIKNARPIAGPPASHQKISIIIPSDATPGAVFAIQLSSWPSPITITCPFDARPGDLMELSLPTDQVLSAIQVRYPSESWVRTVRFSDLQFQWVLLRGENSSIVDEHERFHFYKSAFCRTVHWLEGNDPRLYTGGLSFVPAARAVVASRLVIDADTVVTYAELSHLQGCPRIDKHDWFLEMCRKMVKVDNKHIRIAIRRDNLLPDSLRAIMSLEREDLRRVWEIKFIGEEVQDQGGPMKEWFEIVTTRLLDPDAGYFVFSQNNAAAVEINPTSYIVCASDHLLYYRFFGRLLGRALYCGHLIKGHFTQVFFKFLLGWPINSMDIADATLYKSLVAIANADDVEGHHYTFTVSENAFFKHVDHELIDDGLTTFVSLENRDLFLERMIRYYLFERTLPQLTEVMLGFLDVVPEPLLTIFDASELELILCGLPQIDVFDWQANTTYRGLFAEKGPMEQTVQWFWQVVEEFDMELRARLLQFATGSSGVPFLGFQHLRGHDDRPNLFTIEGVPPSVCYYPKAHACFNKIDLPVFDSIESLRERLTFSVTTAFVGFNDE